MSIHDQLSYSLGLKTQEGNKALAKAISDHENDEQLNELVQFLDSKPKERLQMDAILTVAYIAESKPEMLVGHISFLIKKLNDPINRVIWGSMIALAHIAHLVPKQLFEALPKIIDAMEMGTVVTRDHGFRILVSLYKEEKYCEDSFYIILEQVMRAPNNQLGQYTERMIPILHLHHKNKFIATLEDRGRSLSNEYHLKRLTKHLKKLYK